MAASDPARRVASRSNAHPTLGDLCAELGLSAWTVSTALNHRKGKRGISAATVGRVRAHAARRGYVPDRGAARTRSDKSSVFGLLISSHLRHPHMIEALNLFMDRAIEYPGGMETVFCRDGGLASGLTEMAARRITRFVWLRSVGSEQGENGQVPLTLVPQFDRVVVYNYDFNDSGPDKFWDWPNVARVGVSRDDAFLRLGAEFRRLGHRRVAYLSYTTTSSCSRDTPLRRGMAANGIETVYPVPENADRPPNSAYGPMLARMALEERERGTTALFGDDHEMAQTLQALRALGVAVPKDMSVAGFNGSFFTALLTPPMANLAMPVAEMVDKAFSALRAPETPADQVLPMELQLRESLGPAPDNLTAPWK